MPAELEFYILRGSERIDIGREELPDGSVKSLGAGLRIRAGTGDLISDMYRVYVNNGAVEINRALLSFDGRTEALFQRLLPGQSCLLEVLISHGIVPNLIKITNTA